MKFSLGQILSVSTGKLFCREIGELYDILNFMTQDNLYTHQLPRATDEVKRFVVKQLPWLNDIDASGVNYENVWEWLNEQISLYGAEHELMPALHWNSRDPVEELEDMVGRKRVIVIRPPHHS